MNEEQWYVAEKEVDLKQMLFYVLLRWRLIIVLAVIISLVIGLGSFGLNVLRLNDEEFMATQERSFQMKHAAYIATGESLETEIANLNESKARQEEYNEASIIMDINYLSKQIATVSFYVDTNYQIYPELSVQNTDIITSVLSAYRSYLTNGEMYNYVMDKLGYDIELRYLQELLSTSVDFSTNMITVQIIHSTEDACNEMAQLITEGILGKQQTIIDSIGTHTLQAVNESAYAVVDFDLDERQKNNRQYIADLDITLQEKNEELIEYRREVEPVFEFTLWETFKGMIKTCIIAGVVGLFVVAIFLALRFMMADNIYNGKDLKRYCRLEFLGELPCKKKKRAFSGIDQKLLRMFGIGLRQDAYDNNVLLIRNQIIALLEADLEKNPDLRTRVMQLKQPMRIAIAGTVAKELCEALRTRLQDAQSTLYTIHTAGDILTDGEAVSAVRDADIVIFMENCGEARYSQLMEEAERVRSWGKQVLGVVLNQAEAI